MMKRVQWQLAVVGAVGLMVACSAEERTVEPRLSAGSASHDKALAGSGGFQFTPLASSAACTNGGSATNPLVLPTGFQQTVIASEGTNIMDDSPDMNTQNENGPQPGRYLYRVSEGSKPSLAVTDLLTGVTKVIFTRTDLESLDPTVWTPWGTLLFAEETNAAARRDPAFPQAVAGLVYEVFFDPNDLTKVVNVLARPAIGSKSHEGMRFDTEGNLYSISERTPGYIFKFVPDTKGDLSSGLTYVLKITQPDGGDRTGIAQWVVLPRATVQIDASAAADLVAATGYGRPEDLEISTSSGNNHGGPNTLYAAITSEHRILAIDLRTLRVSDYVARGLNTDAAFNMPDNLALDHSGNLYITEDPGGSTSSGKTAGDDIWVAAPAKGNGTASASVDRFASLNDCDAEPTGIYFDLSGWRLFVNIQHRGGDRIDKTMAITAARGK